MVYRFDKFELDTASVTLRVSGRLIDVPPKAVELLAVLVSREGAVVSKRELMDALWPDGFVEEANLTQHVYVLRRAFRQHGIADFIETVPRRGYDFKRPAEAAHRRSPLARYAAGLTAAVVLLFAGTANVSHDARAQLHGEALQAYTLGRYFFNLRSMAAMRRSVGYFRKVIALEPHNALGYAGLADSYTELADFARPCPECRVWASTAERISRQATAIDPSSAEAHIAYAMVLRIFDNDDTAAAREFHTALRLDPNNALANQWYGNFLIAQGFAEQGVRRLQIAAAQQPISTATYAWLARGCYYERRYDDAIRFARQALALEPTRLETTVLLGLAEEARGNGRDALREFRIAARMGNTIADTQALLAGVNATMGERGASLTTLHRLAGGASAYPSGPAHRLADRYDNRSVTRTLTSSPTFLPSSLSMSAFTGNLCVPLPMAMNELRNSRPSIVPRTFTSPRVPKYSTEPGMTTYVQPPFAGDF